MKTKIRMKITNFWKNGNTDDEKVVVVGCEANPGNGVTLDSLKIPIKIL